MWKKPSAGNNKKERPDYTIICLIMNIMDDGEGKGLASNAV